jgi:hypothetical protein
MTITDLIVISLPEHNAKSLPPSSGSQWTERQSSDC